MFRALWSSNKSTDYFITDCKIQTLKGSTRLNRTVSKTLPKYLMKNEKLTEKLWLWMMEQLVDDFCGKVFCRAVRRSSSSILWQTTYYQTTVKFVDKTDRIADRRSNTQITLFSFYSFNYHS